MLEDARTLRFSLREIPQAKRREMATEVIARAFANINFTPLSDALEMEFEFRPLQGAIITDTRISPHKVTSAYDRSRASDDFALCWALAPVKGVLRQFGKEQHADGTAVLLSCADPFDCESRDTVGHTVARLQRSLLMPLLPDAEAALMRPVPPNSEALQLLKSYCDGLRALSGAESTEPEFKRVAGTHIADLVALAVGTTRDAAQLASERGLRAARLNALKEWVLTHLTSPDLSLSTAAAAAGLGPRSVQLLFEAEGGTFTGYVARERLALAHRRLSMPTLARIAVSEIAFSCGFGDLSHFTRSFRKAYGESPTDVRRKAFIAKIRE
ncbi:MAG: helix-turn-helix transcriptional regulator [Methylobacillus sp.]|jgi:AraC-like DNA-binding protein|nr:helix-turn-helix transcriptional regulator [Methylobacillus sp.]